MIYSKTDAHGNISNFNDTECTVLHREDGPAIVCLDGTKMWFRHGKLHREDGPAFETLSGNHEWWLDDVLYRTGTTSPIGPDGTWRLTDDECELHCTVGPAVHHPDGRKEWWVHGVRTTEARVLAGRAMLEKLTQAELYELAGRSEAYMVLIRPS